VKHAFRDRETWTVLTKKPVQAREDEARDNPRSRSAKLRAAEKKARRDEEE
jgi:16S rRNA (cytosine1402-N4)-methyltransferase